MLALQERVAQQFAVQPSLQQTPQQQSPTADAARMWQSLLFGSNTNTVGFGSSTQSSNVGRTGSTPSGSVPQNGNLSLTANPLLDLQSLLGNAGTASSLQAAASSLLGAGTGLGGLQSVYGQQQHPLYQHGVCSWPQCNQVTYHKFLLLI